MKTRKLFTTISLGTFFICACHNACQAELTIKDGWFYHNGVPTPVHLVCDYNDPAHEDLTWLDWDFAMLGQTKAAKFISTLVVYVNGEQGTEVYQDWRLPMTPPEADQGYDPIVQGEMAHLYYGELQNSPIVDLASEAINMGEFVYLSPAGYWSTSEGADYATYGWYFSFATGYQGQVKLSAPLNMLAVRSGQVVDQQEQAPTPVLAEYEDNCEDGIDNDGNGKIDCADKDCIGVEVTDGVCARFEKKGMCYDGWDNDGDGLVDGCDDGCSVNADLNCERQ